MLFIYLDESGNYTFSKNGSEYLIYTALSTSNPYELQSNFCSLEQELINKKISIESGYFHATEDKQAVRNEVFTVLKNTANYEIDCVIVEKCKANPSLYIKRTTKKTIHVKTRIYKKIYRNLLQYILARYKDKQKIIIYVDEAPDSRKRHEFEKGFKEAIKEILIKLKLQDSVRYHIQFLNSLFSYGLQATDYCCWAIKKKKGDWAKNPPDERPFKEIEKKISSESDIFSYGDGHKYY
ncbi:MAG: DUF3800 domain-containing protein [Candidatus Omnitrophica bacterium]|nr:DUF3800 domain-containing protein [Candidatus Omnitrophota bacterium]